MVLTAEDAVKKLPGLIQMAIEEIVYKKPIEVPVEGPSDFVKYFTGDIIRHFYIPGLLGPCYKHHFAAKSSSYEEEQECMVRMIHYAPPEEKKTEGAEGAQGDCCGKTGERKQKVENKEPDTNTEAPIKSIIMRYCFRFKVQNNEATYISGNTAGCEVYFNLLKKGKWTQVTYPEQYPKTKIELDQAWEVAVECKDKTNYNLFTSNCEHLIIRIMAGVGFSKQVSDGIKAVASSSASSSVASSVASSAVAI